MHPAALWATVLAEGSAVVHPAVTGAITPSSSTASETLSVAIVGGISLIVVALIPELFRWLRRNAPVETPTAVVTPQALEAAEARIASTVEVRTTQALERANAARAEVRALRKVMEAMRDELNRHVWTAHEDDELPAPRAPVE